MGRRVDDAIARVMRELQKRALRATHAADRDAAAAYARAAARIKKRVGALARPSARAVMDIASDELEAAARTLISPLEGRIIESVTAGVRADGAIFEAVFRDRAVPPRARELIARRIASARIRGRTSFGEIPLSRRLHQANRQVAVQMRAELERRIRAGDTVLEVADRLLELDDPIVRLPQAVDRVRAAIRDGDLDSLTDLQRELGRMARARVKGPLGMVRAATQELRRKVISGRPEVIEKAIDRWVLDRATHQARTIARTETVSAFRDGYESATEDREWVKGYRWVLSPNHPRADVCDVLAGQDAHGLGPGGYPKGETPQTPHPNDLCRLDPIVDDRHFERERARRAGEREPPRDWESGSRQTAAEWLRAQPAEVRRAILGPTRARLLEQGRSGRVLRDDGTIRPVWEAQGRAGAGARAAGTAVRAAPLVKQDRTRRR